MVQKLSLVNFMHNKITGILCIEQVINYRTNERSDSLASQLIKGFFSNTFYWTVCAR